MPFMVIYSTSDGGSCHEQADAIDEAALFVERLRNQDGIEEIHIFRMEEISFAFRPYYKVELGMPERQADPPVVSPRPAPPAPEVTDEPPVAEVAVAEVAVEATPSLPSMGADPTGVNSRRGLFGR